MTTEREAQTVLAEIALQLVAIEDRLTRLGDSLPVPPNQEDMLEHRVPYDVVTELAGMIGCGRGVCEAQRTDQGGQDQDSSDSPWMHLAVSSPLNIRADSLPVEAGPEADTSSPAGCWNKRVPE